MWSSTDKAAKDAQLRLSEVKSSVAKSLANLNARKEDKVRVDKGDEAVSTFLSAWSGYVTEGKNPGQVGFVLSELAQKSGLVGNRRPTPMETDYPFGNGLTPVQTVGFSVVGEYKQAMEWLGKVEDRFPFSRIEGMSISSSGVSEIEMLVNLSFLMEENK